jgi:hypothetical protein
VHREPGRRGQSQEAHERQTVVHQEFGALVGGIVRRLNDKNFEHHHRIKRRSTALAALRIGQSQNEIAAKCLEIDRRPKRLKLVASSAASCEYRRRRNPVVRPSIHPKPSKVMESEMRDNRQGFLDSSLNLFDVTAAAIERHALAIVRQHKNGISRGLNGLQFRPGYAYCSS